MFHDPFSFGIRYSHFLLFYPFFRSQDEGRRRIFCLAALPYLLKMTDTATSKHVDDRSPMALPPRFFESSSSDGSSEDHQPEEDEKEIINQCTCGGQFSLL